MSHANGQVRFPDGKVMHFEFNSTCNVTISCLYETYEEMVANWRQSPWRNCTCGQNEAVELYTDACDTSWNGRACRKCRAITDAFMPEYDNPRLTITEGKPDWVV